MDCGANDFRPTDDERKAIQTYASVLDTFGQAVEAVEPVLDALLEQLCGAAEPHWPFGDPWMSAVIEDGDAAAEAALRCPTAATAADYSRRTVRVAASFARSFWPPPVRAPLAACLLENLKAAVAAASGGQTLSSEHFIVCLTAKFAAARRWHESQLARRRRRRSGLFRSEIREPCERFLAADLLLDLMDGGHAAPDVRAFGHAEHLEPRVLVQRLAERASRHSRSEVRHFELADVLVFRFSDGERGRYVENAYDHRFAYGWPGRRSSVHTLDADRSVPLIGNTGNGRHNTSHSKTKWC